MTNIKENVPLSRLSRAVMIGSLSLTGASSVLSVPQAFAEESRALEEVVVLGVAGAQQHTIQLKRNASSVVDSISAEDIGKLPNATIADSLQLISGVQINRSAGEGSSVNVRGLPQVGTMLNGEQFLTPNSIFRVRPDFRDIPSTMFAGADVIKSNTASTLEGGITGTINLKTRRPFDLDKGWTFSGSVEAGIGDETSELDPSVNGLIGWNSDKIGFLIGGSFSESTLLDRETDKTDFGSFAFEEDADNGVNLDGNNASDDTFLVSRFFQMDQGQQLRERKSLNGSFQWDISDAWTVTADAVYTQFDEDETYVWVEAKNRPDPSAFQFDVVENTGVEAPTGNYQIVRQATFSDVEGYASFAQAMARESDSTNINLEFDYDNGGPLTGSFRYIYADAAQSSRRDSIDQEHWTNLTADFPNDGMDGPVVRTPNPAQNSVNPTITYGKEPSISNLWAATDPEQVSMRTGWGTREDAGADVSAFRGDISYEFDYGILDSVDAGARSGSREVDVSSGALVSPVTRTATSDNGSGLWSEGDEVTTWVRWRATDVSHPADGRSTVPYRTMQEFSEDGFPVIQAKNFEVSGAPESGILSIDPQTLIDDPEAFHEAWAPGAVFAQDAGLSYRVDLDTTSYYTQFNFSGDIGGYEWFSNIGVRVVENDLTVVQNISDGTIDPAFRTSVNGSPVADGSLNPGFVPSGAVDQLVTNRSFTDVLPAVNFSVHPSDDVILRFAYTKNLAPLDLNSWAEGLSIRLGSNYLEKDTNPVPNDGLGVEGASQGGNPELDPWRSDNYDLSAEWYPTDLSQYSIGVFRIDVESFLEQDVITRNDLPDADGVVRGRPVPTTIPVNGNGGQIFGMELAMRQGFDYLDGIWGNFGFDANYTFSPSTQNEIDPATSKELPFVDSSEEQFNFVLWYDDGRLQSRVALNHRSDRFVQGGGQGAFLDSGERNSGLTRLFQAPSTFLDASVSYDITSEVSVYLNASNLTNEGEDFYASFKNNWQRTNTYERRFTLGMRANF